MAPQAPLPTLPFYSGMTGTMFPWTANTYLAPFFNQSMDTSTKSKDDTRSTAMSSANGAQSSFFSWMSRNIRPTFNWSRQQPNSNPGVLEAQVDKMFWEMILQDIQQFIIIVEAPGATYNENDKLVLLRLLERAETQFHRTTASWAQLANPQAPGSQPSLQGSIRRCIVPAPTGRGIGGERAIRVRRSCSVQEYLSEGLEASKTKLVNIDGRQLCMRKQHFDESYLDRKSTARSRRRRMRRRGMINSPGHAAQRPNPLSHFITAEDVQYPAFTQQEARWTLATLGKTPAYVCLSAFMVSVTAKYNWEGISHNHALSILKQLQERKDLLVRQDAGSEKTTVERRVQCLKAVLEKMAKEYDLDRKAFTQGISVGTGMADLGKLSRMAIPGQQDVKVVQELVAELLHGRS